MTWQQHELAILRAVVEAEDAGLDVHQAAQSAVDMPSAAFMATVARLAAANFIEAAILRNGSGQLVAAHVQRALPRALEEIGRWPNSEDRLKGKQARRLAFMRRLYDMSEGDTLSVFPWAEVAEPFGWPDDEIQNVVYYLSREGLLETEMGAQVSITHAGVVEVEEALRQPKGGTDHFPPTAIEQHFHGPVTGSLIQTGSPAASQQVGSLIVGQQDVEVLHRVVAELERLSEEGPEELQPVASARAATIKTELALPSPDPGLLRESVRSLRSVAESVAGSGVWAGLLQLLGLLSF